MRSGAGAPQLKVFGTAVVALVVGLTTASCSEDGPPEAGPRPSATPGSAAAPSMTFEEAYRRLPMEGTKDLPITWELSGAPTTGEVLAARRGLVFFYWLLQATDWTSIIPVGRFVYSDRYYQKILAPVATTSDTENPSIGPLWIKYMGIEKTGPDRATVTFCSDLGYWHGAENKDFKVRKNRANIESYELQKIQPGDGAQRWVADRRLDPDVSRDPKYDAECRKWARHQP